MKYVIIGSALAGNKGAASMLEASIQGISKLDPHANFTLLSIYPDEDKRLNTYKQLRILPTKPLILGLLVNPLALVYKIIAPLRPLLRKQKHIKIIVECDVFLDQGGITFVDGRSKFLIYNIASILPAKLLKRPIVKCSQAMGPFNSRPNRISAKILLPKIAKILARGETTYQFLDQLGLRNIERAADYAFSLRVSSGEQKAANAILKAYNYNPKKLNVAFCPSQVLQKKNPNYAEIISSTIDKILADNNVVIYLIPHSQRMDKNKLHNNDIPVCAQIYDRVSNKERCIFIEKYTSPQQTRYILGKMRVAVVGRFHAMVSALCVETPVVVTGWSHKYKEVLEQFDIKEAQMDSKQLSAPAVYNKYCWALKQHNVVQQKIAENIGRVRDSSKINTLRIVEIANAQQ